MKKLLNDKGYTFIEMIVAVAVVGVLLSLSIVNAQMDQDILLKKCANKLVQDIRYIQMKTIYEKNPGYKIYANYGDSRYQYKIIQPGKLEVIEFDKGIYFISTIKNNFVQFEVTGVPVQPGSFKLGNSKGTQIEITIEFTTGRVRMRYINKK
jgi:prepilin-type N-terminal cleavage/methylation domain-containing protein